MPTANVPKTSHNLRNTYSPNQRRHDRFRAGLFRCQRKGEITTFGRGGSDYSAAVIAAALNAEVLEVWKDVPGYMSADPKFVPEAQMIPLLSYDEAAELSYFGAKILHPRTVEPSGDLPRHCREDTMNPDAPGSLITAKSAKARFLSRAWHTTRTLPS